MRDAVIKVQNVSKTFKLPHEKHTSLKGVFINIFRGKRTYEKQQVLKDISLEVQKGEFFGVIGRNGNGKSTLLKLLAGVYAPDSGAIQINGKLTPFIELGVGFNPELTGRENVYLNGALLGFSQKEMSKMYGDIVGFAELEDFMDQKLKNYSSGMQVRLAFSIAIRAKSDILLIDEVLAVGDVNFQKKCIEVFETLKREGRTIVFVSHAMGYVRDFCDRTAVVNRGKIEFVGDTEKAIDIYNNLNEHDESHRIEADNKKNKKNRYGNGRARMKSITILNEKGEQAAMLVSRKKFSIITDISINEHVKNLSVGIMFRKNPKENLFGINNVYDDIRFGPFKKGETLRVSAAGTMPLAPGNYTISLYIADAQSASNYSELDTLDDLEKVMVVGRQRWGLLATDVKMELKKYDTN